MFITKNEFEEMKQKYPELADRLRGQKFAQAITLVENFRSGNHYQAA